MMRDYRAYLDQRVRSRIAPHRTGTVVAIYDEDIIEHCVVVRWDDIPQGAGHFTADGRTSANGTQVLEAIKN